MTYKEARVYLDEVSKYGSVLGLDTIRDLLAELGDPQEDLRFIHIAGTNGKGSVLAYTSAILREAGYRTGSYVSPTVVSYLERIQVDGEWIPEEAFAGSVEEVREAACRMKEKGLGDPTVFEIETAVAFLYFQRQRCDLVVLETGLGGAADATNVVKNTEVAVFAEIGRDHMAALGDTLEEIAFQKAGILKKGCFAATAWQKEEVSGVLKEQADRMGCRVYAVDPEQIRIEAMDIGGICFSYKTTGPVRLALSGTFQAENAALACETVRALSDRGYVISGEALKRGLENTRWPGRFECIRRDPLFLIDGAHNEDAAVRLRESIDRCLAGKKIVGIMGVFRDKEYDKIARQVVPALEKVYTVDLPDLARTLPAEALAETAGIYCRRTEAVGDVETAVRRALGETEENGAILAFGSLSYLGQVRRLAGDHMEQRDQKDGK